MRSRFEDVQTDPSSLVHIRIVEWSEEPQLWWFQWIPPWYRYFQLEDPPALIGRVLGAEYSITHAMWKDFTFSHQLLSC